MKSNTQKLLSYAVLLSAVLLFSQCKTEEPEPVIEEELITTLTMTFSPVGGGDDVVFKLDDEDGNGPIEPVYTNGILEANTDYKASIELRNEQEGEDITVEVQEKGAEHQFFFEFENSLKIDFAYDDADANGDAIGLATIFTTGDVSNGTLTVVLRHESDKSADGAAEGDLSNAGGETDIQAIFDVVIE